MDSVYTACRQLVDTRIYGLRTQGGLATERHNKDNVNKAMTHALHMPLRLREANATSRSICNTTLSNFIMASKS